MGVVFRQSVKTSLVTITGAALGAFTIWLSTRFIADKQQFGFTKNFTTQALTLAQIFTLGLNSTMYMYLHKYVADIRKRKVLLSLTLGIPLVITLLSCIFYFFFRAQFIYHFQPADRPFMARYFNWLPLYTLLFMYMAFFELYLGSQTKVAVSAFIREVVLRVLNIIIIMLFAFGYIDFHSLVIGSVLIYFVPIVVLLTLCFKTPHFGFSFRFNVFTRSEYKDMSHFTWYHFLMSFSVILMASLGQLSLPLYDHKGLTSVAGYSVALFIISFLQIPSKAFLSSSYSMLTTAVTENNMDKARDIFSRASLNILIPTVAVAILICCNLHNAVDVIGNNKNYSEVTGIFLVLLIGTFVDISTGMNDQVLSVTNYYKFNFYVSVVVTIMLFIMLRFLIPVYGVYGAAWSTTAALILFNVCKYLFIWKKLNMQPYSSGSFRVMLAGLPALAAGYFFPFLFNPARHIYVHTFIDSALRSTIIVIVYIIMLVWLKPSKDLETYIASLKKNKRLF